MGDCVRYVTQVVEASQVAAGEGPPTTSAASRHGCGLACFLLRDAGATGVIVAAAWQ